MSAPERDDTTATSARVAAARARVAEAAEAYEVAHAVAVSARRERTHRAARVHGVVAVGSVLVTVALIVTAVVLVSLSGGGRADSDRAAEVLAAARDGVVMTLTADPSQPKEYVESVLAMSTGEFRQRITTSAAEIESLVASQPFAGRGQVISAGVVGADPASGASGSGADVLVVAEATNPQLVGGGAGDARVVLLVRMTQVDGSWKIERAQLQ